MINIFRALTLSLKNFQFITTGIAIGCLCSCSVFNPNPGENEADAFIQNKQYDNAITIIEPLAEQGVPWAELRLGIAYEYGRGKNRNTTEALAWYKKAAIQMKDLPWADGMQVISAGDAGYFNQNNDAKVAQYLIARLYAQGAREVPKNLSEAWLWANYVRQASEGNDILFCCENSKLKTQYIEFSRIEKLLADLENNLTAEELQAVKSKASEWRPR